MDGFDFNFRARSLYHTGSEIPMDGEMHACRRRLWPDDALLGNWLLNVGSGRGREGFNANGKNGTDSSRMYGLHEGRN